MCKMSSRDLCDLAKVSDYQMLTPHTQLCSQRSLEWVDPGMLTKSTLSRQSCAHLAPPLLWPLSCLPFSLRHSLFFSSSSAWVTHLKSLLEEFRTRSSFRSTMLHSSSICRVLLLVLLGLLVAYVHTGKPLVESDICILFLWLIDKNATLPAWEHEVCETTDWFKQNT